MSEELKPCPMCGGPAEMDTLRGYRRWSDGSVGNAIAVYCTECTLEISVCRDDVPDIEPEQVAEMWNRRAQPAAPAVCSSCDGTGKISGLPCAWCMQSAAPSVAPEPVAWTLQSELDAAQTTCSAHLWFTNPRNSAWTALFTREQIAAHPPRAPLTEEIESADNLLRHLGLDPERCRTEGGSLNVSRIKTLLADAAPSVAPEPVAWRWSESNGERWFDWTADWTHHDRAKSLGYRVEYAHPPRAPLTRREIESVMTEHYPLDCLLREKVDAFEACVRDLEAAHGISAEGAAK